jgi:hypothetical protein
MNADLREGLTDGVVKKLAPNRGNLTDAYSAKAMYNVLDPEYFDPSFSDSVSATMAMRQTQLKG